MKGRLEGVIDLHAADAQYHVSCYKDFTAPMNVKYVAEKKQTDPSECTTDDSFDSLIIKMTEDPSLMWTSIKLHELNRHENGQIYFRKTEVTFRKGPHSDAHPGVCKSSLLQRSHPEV